MPTLGYGLGVPLQTGAKLLMGEGLGIRIHPGRGGGWGERGEWGVRQQTWPEGLATWAALGSAGPPYGYTAAIEDSGAKPHQLGNNNKPFFRRMANSEQYIFIVLTSLTKFAGFANNL